MKFVKLSIFALTMGLFVASCGNGEGNKVEDSTATAAPVVVDTPAATPPPAPVVDSAAIKAAADSAAKATKH